MTSVLVPVLKNTILIDCIMFLNIKEEKLNPIYRSTIREIFNVYAQDAS